MANSCVNGDERPETKKTTARAVVRRAWSSLGLLVDQTHSDERTAARAAHGHGHSHREMAVFDRVRHRVCETDRLLAGREFSGNRQIVKSTIEILRARVIAFASPSTRSLH